MKAVRFHEFGPIENLVYEDCDTPEPKPNEALVKVEACALNHLDLWIRAGATGAKVMMPHILGCDMAGEVMKCGELVTHVHPGDKVMVAPGIGCGRCRECLRGDDNLCRSYSMLGYVYQGGYAEYCAVPGPNLIPKPERLSMEEAASIPLVFLTAWHMLVGRVSARPGEDVLIHAAGSGVGIAAIQVAKLLGCRVLTTASTDAKLEKARALGADETINYQDEDWVKRVRDLTNKRGVDIIVDSVGETVWEGCIKSLAMNGRLVTCGATAGPNAKFDIRFLFAKHLNLYGSYMGSKGELLTLLPHVANGTLKPVVDSVAPLSEAAAMQRKMADRHLFGKLVLKPEHA